MTQGVGPGDFTCIFSAFGTSHTPVGYGEGGKNGAVKPAGEVRAGDLTAGERDGMRCRRRHMGSCMNRESGMVPAQSRATRAKGLNSR